jgi:hypothetical protein
VLLAEGVRAQPKQARVPRRFGQAGGARRVGRRLSDGWSDQGELRQNSPHAIDPRRRKYGERFGRHAREAARLLRTAFERWPKAAGRFVLQSLRRWPDRPGARYGGQLAARARSTPARRAPQKVVEG